MLLSELLRVIDYKEIINRSGIDVEDTSVGVLCCDSRKVSADSMFVCISGAHSDGHDFAKSAYACGCRIFVSEKRIRVPDD